MAKRIRQAIVPKGIPMPSTPYSPAVKAGPWVFVSGQLPTDFSEHGLPPEARRDPLCPDLQLSELRLQSEYVYPLTKKILDAGGSSFENTVRTDRFGVLEDTPTGHISSVTDAWLARNAYIPASAGRPASTGMRCSNLPVKSAIFMVEFVAIANDSEWKKEAITSPRISHAPAGYSHAIRVGPYVFCSGDIPTDWNQGVAPAAQTNKDFWYGSDFELQTRFTLDRLSIILEDAGSSRDLTVKAQVYLTAEGMREVGRLDEIWKEYFPKNPPARTITPTDGLGGKGCLIEINFVALTRDGGIKPETIEARGVPKWPLHEPHAVRAGNLVFLSTGIAADEKGHFPDSCRVNPNYPWHEKGIRKQIAYILGNAEKIVQAAGGSGFDNIVRTQTIYSNFEELCLGSEIWNDRFGPDPPANTIVEYANCPLPVPGATVALDLWAYIP